MKNPVIARTTEGIRDALFDEIDELRGGGGDIKRAKALAAMAQNILKAAELDLKFAEHVRRRPQGEAKAMPAPIALGHAK